MNQFETIYSSIIEAINNPLQKHAELTGFSGEKLLSSLINLSKLNLNEDKVYLEVGVFQGLSLLSLANNIGHSSAFGIDNFAFFDKDGKNEGIVKDRIKKLNLKNVKLINCDYEDALENLDKYIGSKKVGLFFIDGPHDYRSQLMCLLLIQPYLSDDAIIVIDDCNYRHVRQANRDFLKTNNMYKLFFEAYTRSHPTNMNADDLEKAKKGWWNGVNIIVRDKENVLNEKYPETLRDRTLYENEHILCTQKYPLILTKLIRMNNFFGYLFSSRFRKKIPNYYIGQYDNLNTYSEEIASNDFTFNYTHV